MQHFGYNIKTTTIMPYLINTGMFDGAIANQVWIMKMFGCYFLEQVLLSIFVVVYILLFMR